MNEVHNRVFCIVSAQRDCSIHLLSYYTVMFPVFTFPKEVKLALSLHSISLVWLLLCFFVVVFFTKVL